MVRLAFSLLLLSATALGAEPAVDMDTAAQLYQAAALREQVRPALATMPDKMREMFAADPNAHLTEQQLAAVSSAAERGFRIDVFEAPALAALAANLDQDTFKKSMAFLSGDLGRRMVDADVALAKLDEPTTDKVMSGEIPVSLSPARAALVGKVETATRSTEGAVEVYLTIAQAVAVGTAIGSGMDPIAAQQRAQRAGNAANREALEQNMRASLRNAIAYGYRTLSDADLKAMLAFLQSPAGTHYVRAYLAAISAGYDAMGKRCGEQIGESWRELAIAQSAVTKREGASPSEREPLPAPYPAPAVPLEPSPQP